MFSRLWVVACHRGGTGNQGLFAPQSSCPGSSWRQGSHLPFTSTGLLRWQRHITIRDSAKLAHTLRTQVPQMLRHMRWLVVFATFGAAVQRRPRK